LAEVDSVKVSVSAGRPTYFVTVVEHPSHSYNWALLKLQQTPLKDRFGNQRAYADPDHGAHRDGNEPSTNTDAKLANTIITISTTLGRIACRLCAGAASSDIAAGSREAAAQISRLADIIMMQ